MARVHFFFSALLLLDGALAAMAPGAWSLGPTTKGVTVEEVRATLTLPKTPDPVTGYATLWFGLGTDNSDLYQSLAYNGPPSDPNCNKQLWCADAFVLHTSGDPSVGAKVSLPPGTKLTWHYQRRGSDMLTSLEAGGKIVSSTTTPYRNPIGAGTAVECHTSPAGLIQGHVWSDISVRLSAADPNLKNTHGGGCLDTSDGGVTWTCGSWKVDAWNCDKI